VLARFFGVPVETVTYALRLVVLLVPPVTGWVTYVACRELRAREAQPRLWTALRRGPGGGYVE